MKKAVAILTILISVIFCVFSANWKKTDVLDDFGDPTGEYVVESGNFSGTFKNQSTTDGKVTFSISVSETGKMIISLMESGAARDLSTTSGGAWMVNDKEVYKVQIKYDNGSVYSYDGLISRNADYKYRDIFISNSEKNVIDMRDELIENKTLRIVITGSKGSYSLGSVDTSTITETLFFDRTLLDEGLRLQRQGKYQEALEKFNELKSTDKESYCHYQVEISESKRNNGMVEVGDIGPAGGIIFYDCDADNDSGNADGLRSKDCGWRYLEAAPADLRVINGVPTVDSSNAGFADASKYFKFGYYIKERVDMFVNGKSRFDSDCTGTSVGKGKNNTEKLVKCMKTSASDGWSSTAEYAARLCDILEYTVNDVTYDDWFLPSQDELNLMYVNLHEAGLGGFGDGYYWSSSEDSSDAGNAWTQYFKGGSQARRYRSDNNRIRAVRAF